MSAARVCTCIRTSDPRLIAVPDPECGHHDTTRNSHPDWPYHALVTRDGTIVWSRAGHDAHLCEHYPPTTQADRPGVRP